MTVIALVGIVCIIFLHSRAYALNNGLGLTPHMGWNEYNHYHNNINEVQVAQTAKRIADLGLRNLGYTYIVLDDCWQSTRNASGHITTDSQFPSGIKPLADYVHSLGFKFGLYSDAGTLTCENRPGSLGYETMDANDYASWGVDLLKSVTHHMFDADTPLLNTQLTAASLRVFLLLGTITAIIRTSVFVLVIR